MMGLEIVFLPTFKMLFSAIAESHMRLLRASISFISWQRRRIFVTVLRIISRATSSETLSLSELPKYVYIAWLNVSKAPDMTCMYGTVFVYSGLSTANWAYVPKRPPFQCFASCVMTQPLFISEPVPEAVTIAPTGMPAVGKVRIGKNKCIHYIGLISSYRK